MENVKKETKLVQRDYFNMLKELAIANNRPDLADFCDNRLDQLDKKANSSKSKSGANQALNNEITTRLIAELGNMGRPVTLTEFMKNNEYASQFSTQKMRYLFKQPIADGIIINTVEKGKSYFSVAE